MTLFRDERVEYNESSGMNSTASCYSLRPTSARLQFNYRRRSMKYEPISITRNCSSVLRFYWRDKPLRSLFIF